MKQAILTSLVFGLAVQLVGFAIARSVGKERIMIGWGLSSILRFLALGVYAWVVVPALGLPIVPALLSLAAVLFITTLIEPLLLAL